MTIVALIAGLSLGAIIGWSLGFRMGQTVADAEWVAARDQEVREAREADPDGV